MKNIPECLTRGIKDVFFTEMARLGIDVNDPYVRTEGFYKRVKPSLKTSKTPLKYKGEEIKGDFSCVYLDNIPYISSTNGWCAWYTIMQFYNAFPKAELDQLIIKYNKARELSEKKGEYIGTVIMADLLRWAKHVNVPVWDWNTWVKTGRKNQKNIDLGAVFVRDGHVFCTPPKTDYLLVDSSSLSVLVPEDKPTEENAAIHGIQLLRKWAVDTMVEQKKLEDQKYPPLMVSFMS